MKNKDMYSHKELAVVSIANLVDEYLSCIYGDKSDWERIECHKVLAGMYNLAPIETRIITDNLPVIIDVYDDTEYKKAWSLVFNGFKAISDMKAEGKTFKNINQIKEYLSGKGRGVFENNERN